MPTARQHAAGAAVSGSLYVVGGRTTDSSQLRTVERLDPRSGRWETLAPLPQGTSGAEAEAASGQLVVAGGEDPTATPGWVTPAVWSFDPAEEKWSRLPDMRVARHGHASAAIGDRVYVFEGVDCVGGFGGTDTAESLSVR
jgi:N-acetylneuraminic acid mutarotase